MNASSTMERFEYVTANDVFAGLAGGGSIRVEEWPGGDLGPVAKRVGGNAGVLLIEIDGDFAEPIDTISMHPEESNRLTLIDRAISALENAREALTECGYVDLADRKGDQ